MKNSSYQFFMETLRVKVPDRKVLVKQLMDLLCLEKEAVYRRLRQIVPFSFSEMELIAKKYQISLDSIVNNPTVNDMIFYLEDYDFIDTLPRQLKNTEEYVKLVSRVKEDDNSEIGCATNSIPTTLLKTTIHRNLYYLILYKWRYKYGKYDQFPLFSEFKLPDHLLHFNDWYSDVVTEAAYTSYIFDEDMIYSLVKDILYFKKIGFINEEEVGKLKTELMVFLDYIERIAASGKFKSGKRVDIFISQVKIESGYSYISSEVCSFAFLKHFILSYVTSVNAGSVPKVKEWLRALKRSSFQISVSGELQRMYYLNQQRSIVNQL